MKKMLSIKETMHVTGLTENSIRCGINEGIFPAFRVGKSKRGKFIIDIEEFQKVIKDLALRNLKTYKYPHEDNSNLFEKEISEIKQFRRFNN